MPRDGDLRRVSAEFGVDEAQVRRDHLISHILHAPAQLGHQMKQTPSAQDCPELVRSEFSAALGNVL